jgi:hypothetical protein
MLLQLAAVNSCIYNGEKSTKALFGREKGIMSALAIAAIVFACLFGTALLGLFLRTMLPEHHLTPESKDVVKLAMGLIATMAALVLGLMTASAKSSFDVQNEETVRTAANIMRLDRVLARYGPETKEIRDLLRRAVALSIHLMWPEDGPAPGNLDSPEMTRAAEGVEDKIRELSPRNELQREFKSRALQISGDLWGTHWLRIAQLSNPVPLLFLVVLVFWLSILFGTFGLFAPHNATVIAALVLCAVAVAGSIFLILEMHRPFDGLMKISPEPMRYALSRLGQ